MELKTILKKLNSDESRRIFLYQVYTPQNTEVADTILRLYSDDHRSIHILDEQIEYARNNDDRDRFLELAKKKVDQYIVRNYSDNVYNAVVSLKDDEIADYAILKLRRKSNTDSLKNGAKLAKQFGKEEEAKKF